MRVLAIISVLLLTGCAGRVTIETTVTGPGGYSLTQKVSGESAAVLKAASQLLDAELTVKGKDVDIQVRINSGQDAIGIETRADETLNKILGSIGAAVVQRLP